MLASGNGYTTKVILSHCIPLYLHYLVFPTTMQAGHVSFLADNNTVPPQYKYTLASQPWHDWCGVNQQGLWYRQVYYMYTCTCTCMFITLCTNVHVYRHMHSYSFWTSLEGASLGTDKAHCYQTLLSCSCLCTSSKHNRITPIHHIYYYKPLLLWSSSRKLCTHTCIISLCAYLNLYLSGLSALSGWGSPPHQDSKDTT